MRIVARILLFFFVLGMVACSSPEPPPEPVTIRFGYVGFDNLSSERGYYQDLADRFNERYPHITVEVGFSSINTLFFRDAQNRDAFILPDFILGPIRENELILPLDGFVQADTEFPYDDFYSGMLDIYSFEGQTWGIPAGVDPYVFYYNKALFDQAGIPYPGLDWTWDEFLIAAMAVGDPGYGIFGYGSTDILGPDSKYMESIVFIYQHGGKIFDDFKNPSEFVFTDPSTIDALDWYGNLYNVHDVAPTEEQSLEAFGKPVDLSIYQGISNEQIAIWSGALSERGGQTYLPVPWDFEYGILPPPRGKQPFNLVFSDAYVVAAGTEHPDEAWLWLTFLTEQIGYGSMPVRKSVVESKEFDNQFGDELGQLLQVILEDARYFPNTFGGDIGRDFDSYQRALDRIVNQGESASEAMYWAESR